MIETLLDIANGSLVPYKSDALTVSFNDNGCENYALAGFDCNIQGVGGLFVKNPVSIVILSLLSRAVRKKKKVPTKVSFPTTSV